MNSSWFKLLQCLNTKTYKTSTELSRTLGVSERTIYTRLKELNDILRQNGAAIETKTRYGSKLAIIDSISYKEFLDNNEKEIEDQDGIPETSQERVDFLLFYLLNKEDYIKLDDLCDFLHISKGSLTSSLKSVERIYSKYGIQIKRRPNYGIIAVGQEIDIRRCTVDMIIKRNAFHLFSEQRQKTDMKKLADLVLPCMQKFHIRFAEMDFEHFIHHMYVAKRRILKGHIISDCAMVKSTLSSPEQEFIDMIAQMLSYQYAIQLPMAEKEYLALFLAGRRNANREEQSKVNLVIQRDMNQLVMEMLDAVYEEFHVDFRDSFSLLMDLNKHMVPFHIRMNFGIRTRNPNLIDIKKHYMTAFLMASVACTVLAENYKQEISEDEIGFWALFFALALEERKSHVITKRNILIVCESGKCSSNLLKLRYLQEFGDYLQEIFVCGVFELEQFDFSKVDLVFTSVPITRYIPVPILEVDYFLKEVDVKKIRQLLQLDESDYLNKFYQESAFLKDIEGGTKEDVIQSMCKRIIQDRNVPNNLYDLVIGREELGTTDYGNLVALPHPLKSVTKESFAYVGILKEPINWNRYQVQVVFLIVVGQDEELDMKRFYDATFQLITNAKAVEELIKKQDFQTLMNLLKVIN